MSYLTRFVLLAASVAMSPASVLASEDTLARIQADLGSEEAKQPIERQSREAYVTLLNRIDTIYKEVDASEALTLRRKVVEAINRLDEAEARVAEARRTRDAQRAVDRRAKAIRDKQWPADITAAVFARKVQIGMTTEQVQMAWGRPERINELSRDPRRASSGSTAAISTFISRMGG